MVTGEGEWSNKNTNRPPVELLKLSCVKISHYVNFRVILSVGVK